LRQGLIAKYVASFIDIIKISIFDVFCHARDPCFERTKSEKKPPPNRDRRQSVVSHYRSGKDPHIVHTLVPFHKTPIMSTEAPIRRSSRRAKKRSFSIGDIVEINEVSGGWASV